MTGGSGSLPTDAVAARAPCPHSRSCRDHTAALRFICSDMSKPSLTVVARKAGDALHILDRSHIAMHMRTAIDPAGGVPGRRDAWAWGQQRRSWRGPGGRPMRVCHGPNAHCATAASSQKP